MKQLIKLSFMTLLICGAWIMKAQSVSITQGSTPINPYYCMDANNTGTVFTATVTGLPNGSTTGGTITGTPNQYVWSAIGGIDIIAGQGTSQVTVRPKTGTNYSPGQFSKYAKGKLRLTVRIENKYTYMREECTDSGPVYTPVPYTYWTNHNTEIEIKKQFSSLEGNELTGPECVKQEIE